MRKATARNLTALNELRISKKLSQQYIADLLGVSQNTVASWCNNRTAPLPDQIDALADIFGVPREDIVDCITTKRGTDKRSLGNSIPRTFKDTFWSRKRVENNLTLVEVAEAINGDYKQVGRYFTGQSLPTDEEMKIICDLFDVDITTGRREFNASHRAWRGEHIRDKSKYMSSKHPHPNTSEPAPTTAVAPSISAPQSAPEHKISKGRSNDILANLYGKIEYPYFVAVYKLLTSETSYSDALAKLYGAVNYDTFFIISKYFNSEG